MSFIYAYWPLMLFVCPWLSLYIVNNAWLPRIWWRIGEIRELQTSPRRRISFATATYALYFFTKAKKNLHRGKELAEFLGKFLEDFSIGVKWPFYPYSLKTSFSTINLKIISIYMHIKSLHKLITWSLAWVGFAYLVLE